MKIGTLLPALIVLIALQGCHSNSGSGSSQATLRLVNASSTFSSLDLSSSGTVLESAVAFGNASGYVTINSGSTTFALGLGGSGTTSAQTTFSIASGVDYSLVAYTSEQQLQAAWFTDDEPAPATGNGKLRVSNLSRDAGTVDIYVTTPGSAPSAGSALFSNVAGTTAYFQIAAGTYHVSVTGAGNATDLRLDLPSVSISDQQISTLVLTSTTGGVLVNGMLMTQKGAVSAQQNTSARIRLAANVTSNGVVTATANGVSVGSNLRSPVLGSYVLVPAGALSMNATVNGTAVNTGSLSAAAGADLTLLAVGAPASPQFVLLNDDNTLTASNQPKIRLVNGVNGLNDVISLTADFSLLASGVAPDTGSAPAIVNSGVISLLEVDASQANTPLYQATNVNLVSPGVYSVFMLGSNTAPVGIVRRDR